MSRCIDSFTEKRCRPDSEVAKIQPGHRRQFRPSFTQSQCQLPSPTLTRSGQELGNSFSSASTARKRRSASLDCPTPSKRVRVASEPAHGTSSIGKWLSELPRSDKFETLDDPGDPEIMSQPPPKRLRSRSTESLGTSQSGDGSDTVFSENKKYAVYRNPNYPIVLETKGSFMRSSELGMVDEDKSLCDKLLATAQTTPADVLFDDHFGAFHANLRGRSEARICADMHPRVMPFVENLYICGHESFKGLVEGHNDPWIKSISFHGPRPQPDHTIGFKWSNFSEEQRRKLGIEPTKKSLYTAREDIYFAFLTGEVKCGSYSFDLADRRNTHSMTVTQRGIVDLYRRANRADDIHRRVLGFSISHDDDGVQIYAHYPEIDGEKTTYWRNTLRGFTFGDDKGKERWTCYRFTLNVCELFALPLLERLKSLIDELPDPAAQSFELTATLEDFGVQGSQDEASAVESQDENPMRPPRSRGLHAELRSLIQSLQRQLEQQRRDAEQQNKETKEREASLLAQLGQQRKESEQQRKELTEMLKVALQKR